jgi:CelD/BcsL family acetyltransferase involved in cellulose biosynthesis
VRYDHLGYDPAYAASSPGTVLQLLALQALFSEQRFSIFDFTEGEGQHKELFSTGSQLCADFYVIGRRLSPMWMVAAHCATDKVSMFMGEALRVLHLKARVRRLIRQS